MQRLYAAVLSLGLLVIGTADAKPLQQQQLIYDNNGRSFVATTQPAERVVRSRSARVNKETRQVYSDGAGVIRSGKTGKTANVDPAHAAKFQAYINDLENNYGASILFMGGGRGGRCGLANQHACGGGQALDVCQYSWGVVDRRCGLPSPSVLAKIARANGLYEGAEWCHPDTGHVQTRFSGSCRGNLYAAVVTFKNKRSAE